MDYRSAIILSSAFILLGIGLVSCDSENNSSAELTPVRLTGPYLGQELPGNSAKLFAPGIVCNSLEERDSAISPDGKHVAYTVVLNQIWAIVEIKEMDGTWTEPQVASFSGRYKDIEPFFAPDGKRLYFVSNRPHDEGKEVRADYDIWYVEKLDSDWGEPTNLGAPVNTDKNEFYPSLTSDGAIYWTSNYEKSEDIYKSELANGEYQERQRLGDAINTDTWEFNAFISPDEHYLMFSSAGRSDGHGGGDLYISFKGVDGNWLPAVNMGDTVNSNALDYCPFVSADGEYFFFSSKKAQVLDDTTLPLKYSDLNSLFNQAENGRGDIYWISASFIDQFKSESSNSGSDQ